MISGIGTDMIEIQRIVKACQKQAFLMRCFSMEELKFVRNDPIKAAGNWAVKEAVGKAFGTGISGFEMNEIEVLREKNGRPYVRHLP